MNNLTQQFEVYLLESKKVSVKTLRNYRADLNHFLRWASLSEQKIISSFSPSLVGRYKGFHLETQVPMSTTNRRLSTLRNFSRFLQDAGLVVDDPTEMLENLKEEKKDQISFESILSDFKKHLEEQKLSKSTLKNYVSDVRAFNNWLESQADLGWSRQN